MMGREWNVTNDVLRGLLRRRADLRALGIKLGSAFVYSAEEAAIIRAALNEHLERGKARRKDAAPC